MLSYTVLCAGFHMFPPIPFFSPLSTDIPPWDRERFSRTDGQQGNYFRNNGEILLNTGRKVLFEHCTMPAAAGTVPVLCHRNGWAGGEGRMELGSLERSDPGRCARGDSTHCTSAICSGSDDKRLNAIKIAWDRDLRLNFHLQSGKARWNPREGEERHRSGCRPDEPEFQQFSVS